MKKTIAFTLSLAILTGCGGSDDTASQVAQERTATAPALAPTPPAPTPPVKPEPRPAPREPYRYGDDPELDRLWDRCADRDYEACDALYWVAPVGSEYEADALEQIFALEDSMTDREIAELFGVGLLLDIAWQGMTRQEQQDICDGLWVYGPATAGAFVAQGAGGAITTNEAADWLVNTCG
jgi:hypothetical protein